MGLFTTSRRQKRKAVMNVVYLLLFLFSYAHTFSQKAFNKGNLVVLRLGDGTSALSNSVAPVYLDEYSPTGKLVQSVTLPSSGTGHKLVLGGNSTSEGEIASSQDGAYVVVAGYDTIAGVTGASSSATIHRTVAIIGENAVPDISTSLTNVLSASSVRTVATDDGTNFWLGGSNKGTYYAKKGADTGTLIQNAITNSKCMKVIGGNLYLSTAQGSNLRIGQIGSGLPTTAGQTFNGFQGLPTSGSPNSYFFADLSPTIPGFDVLYYADNLAGQGIFKFSKINDTTWVSNGMASFSGSGLTGLAGVATDTGVVLYTTNYTTSASGLNVTVDKSGYNQAITASVIPLLSAPANTGFKSVAFAPTGSGLPITLLSFNGKLDATGWASLWWSVSDNADAAFYTVEASTDGIHYSAVASLSPSKNTTSYTTQYYAGKNISTYYRLSIISKEGKSTYSKEVLLSNKEATKFALYPNPARNSIVLTHSIAIACATIDIYAIDGRKVYSSLVAEGLSSSRIDVSNFKAGTYNLVYSNNGQRQVFTFIKSLQ